MFADSQFAARLDRVTRRFHRDAAESYERLHSDAERAWLQMDGTTALFAGQGSPLTQAEGRFEPEELDRLATFYRGRSDSYEAILTPLAGLDALERVMAAGGVAMQWESLLYRDLEGGLDPCSTALEILEVDAGGLELWESVGRRGFWGEGANPIAEELGNLLKAMPGTRRYLGMWDGEGVASASMTIYDRVAFLGGASTLPDFRGRGFQADLIRRRLADAAGEADLACIGAAPGSVSHRNAERCGFRIAWSQLSLRVPVA